MRRQSEGSAAVRGHLHRVFVVCLGGGTLAPQIHSLLAAGRTGSGYRLKEKKPGSQAGALCRRELRRYFASPVYVLNTGMGLVLMLLTAAASLFAGTDWLDGVLGIPGAAAVIADILPFILALFLSLAASPPVPSPWRGGSCGWCAACR